MREFTDEQGVAWTATVREQTGPDYKGRFYFWFEPKAGGEGVPLLDVRWNTARTADRTLKTMSLVELRRRLRSAVGRTATAEAAADRA
jgi:hypothetical protein